MFVGYKPSSVSLEVRVSTETKTELTELLQNHHVIMPHVLMTSGKRTENGILQYAVKNGLATLSSNWQAG
jgi:hypothetical protein